MVYYFADCSGLYGGPGRALRIFGGGRRNNAPNRGLIWPSSNQQQTSYAYQGLCIHTRSDLGCVVSGGGGGASATPSPRIESKPCDGRGFSY